MPTVEPFPAGGYRFISHQFQYSGGVAAEPGFRIERARFATSLPLADGFDAIEAYLAGIADARRPHSALASCAPRRNSPTLVLSLSIGIMLSGVPDRSSRQPATRRQQGGALAPPHPRHRRTASAVAWSIQNSGAP